LDDGSDGPKGRHSRLRAGINDVLSRLAVIALCLFVAFGLWSLGHEIRTTGRYDYALEVSSGNGDRGSSGRATNVSREVVHAEGAWAMEQGFGFETAALTLVYWSLLIAWGMAGPLRLRAEWSPINSVVTAVSLVLCSTALLAFFPPWRLGWSMSCNAFYIVASSCLYLAMLRDRDKIRAQSQKVFPALICSAIIVAQLFSGYLVGIITGILSNLVLGVHFILLIPKLRAEFWTPGGANSAWKASS
jgi:hypothetical protein